MQIDLNEIEVINNQDARRFEVRIDDYFALIDYIPAGSNIVYSHTEVPTVFEGQGIARILSETCKAAVNKRNKFGRIKAGHAACADALSNHELRFADAVEGRDEAESFDPGFKIADLSADLRDIAECIVAGHTQTEIAQALQCSQPWVAQQVDRMRGEVTALRGGRRCVHVG